MRDVSAADDLALHDLVGFVLVLDEEVDGLALKQRKQALLRDWVVAIVLFEDLELALAEGVPQDHAVRLDVGRSSGVSDAVLARLQRERKKLPHHREILVVDGERRAFILRGQVVFALLCESGKRK